MNWCYFCILFVVGGLFVGLGLFLLVIKVELGIGEVEGLGYYDFMAYIGVPFFNIGGVPGLDFQLGMFQRLPCRVGILLLQSIRYSSFL